MGKWIDRLLRKSEARPSGAPAKGDGTPLLAVLAVGLQGGSRDFGQSAANDVPAQEVPVEDPICDANSRDLVLREAFEERAAIQEFDGGLSQAKAEATAWAALLPPSAEVPLSSWRNEEMVRFLVLRARMIQWGWTEAESEDLADRIICATRNGDPRVSCVACAHYRIGRCGNYQRAGLSTAEVGRDLAGLLQHCPGFIWRN
jgi:hypothetical protein